MVPDICANNLLKVSNNLVSPQRSVIGLVLIKVLGDAGRHAYGGQRRYIVKDRPTLDYSHNHPRTGLCGATSVGALRCAIHDGLPIS